MPPLSSATFQVRPKSLRLIAVSPLNADALVAERVRARWPSSSTAISTGRVVPRIVRSPTSDEVVAVAAHLGGRRRSASGTFSTSRKSAPRTWRVALVVAAVEARGLHDDLGRRVRRVVAVEVKRALELVELRRGPWRPWRAWRTKPRRVWAVSMAQVPVGRAGRWSGVGHRGLLGGVAASRGRTQTVERASPFAGEATAVAPSLARPLAVRRSTTSVLGRDGSARARPHRETPARPGAAAPRARCGASTTDQRLLDTRGPDRLGAHRPVAGAADPGRVRRGLRRAGRAGRGGQRVRLAPAPRRTTRSTPSAERLGAALAEAGYAVITGGGPGVDGGGQPGRLRGRRRLGRARHRAAVRAGHERLGRHRRRLPLLLRPQDDVRQVRAGRSWSCPAASARSTSCSRR